MKRDIHGIIVQDAKEDPSYQDGGDSAFSTGLMAFGGSKRDFDLMPLFIQDGQLVRHPFQDANTGTAPHNDPKATSRDQVLAFFSGIAGKNYFNTDSEDRLKLFMVRTAATNYARSWRVNSDVLSFSNKLYLYKCCDVGSLAPLWLELLGRLNLFIDIIFACFINPKHEVNQITAAACVYGKGWAWLLYKLHPDLFGNLNEYFGGWRNRQEIADAMITKVKAVL